jgi:hypothetical protein
MMSVAANDGETVQMAAITAASRIALNLDFTVKPSLTLQLLMVSALASARFWRNLTLPPAFVRQRRPAWQH